MPLRGTRSRSPSENQEGSRSGHRRAALHLPPPGAPQARRCPEPEGRMVRELFSPDKKLAQTAQFLPLTGCEVV